MFPKTMYVLAPLNPNNPHEGYPNVNDLADEDVVGVYKLKRVRRVKIKSKMKLVGDVDNVRKEPKPMKRVKAV